RFDRNGDIVFLYKNVVQFHLGDLGPDHVEHIGSNLIVGIFQFIDGIVYLVPDDHELYGYLQFDKNIVLRLGLHDHIQLLDLQAQPSGDAVDQGNFQLKPGMPDAMESSEALNGDGCLLFDNKKELEHNDKCYKN